MLSSMVFAQSDPRRLNLASHSVARGFALSLLFHALLFVILEAGYQTGFWKATLLFRKPLKIDAQMARLLAQAKQQREQETPLVFVEVDPTQAAPEPPKDAKYYSALNARAANPDTSQQKDIPKIEGKQEHVPQTMDKAKPKPEALQPAPAPPPEPIAETKPEPAIKPVEPKPEPKPELKPEAKPTVQPGELAMTKPGDEPPKDLPAKTPESLPRPRTPPPPRPRTLEAARRQKGGLAGEKMKQQGGVKRFALEPSFDVRATPFGAYDAAIIAAIQKRWYDLLENRDFAANYSGKVVLEFHLNADGRVTDMRVNQNDVTEILGLLCQRAVQDPAPFAPWPADLRRLVGKEFREVRFTFYYN